MDKSVRSKQITRRRANIVLGIIWGVFAGTGIALLTAERARGRSVETLLSWYFILLWGSSFVISSLLGYLLVTILNKFVRGSGSPDD